MAVPFVQSPEATYASKVNIKFPGTQAAATAAEAKAQTRINESLPTGVTVAIAGGTIKIAT